MQQGNTSFGSRFVQIAWVVKDIHLAEKFFGEVLGVPRFAKMENLQAEDIQGAYYGKPGNYKFHLYLAYSGDTMLELIQPISGQSIYQDYLDRHPEGGVQHIAFMVPENELDKSIGELTGKGHRVIQSLTLPVARVAYFDTAKDIGVDTEIIGLNDAGAEFIKQLKSGAV